MTKIGGVHVSLSAETSSFESGMKQAVKTADTSAAKIKGAFGGIGGALKAGIAGFIGSLSIGALAQVTKAAIDYAGSLGEVSQQLGVTTKDLQTLRYAATQTGVSQSELESGLANLNKTLGQVAAGAQAPAKALQAIGLNAKEVAKLDTGDAFRKIADGLKDIPDRAQRAAVEVALFGEAGGKLDTMLADGSGALNELSDAAERLGIVLSDEEIQRADETADKLDALQTVLKTRIAGAVVENADSILQLGDALLSFVDMASAALRAWNDFTNALDAQAYTLASKNPFLSADKRAEGARRAAVSRGKISDNGVSWGVGGDTVTIDLAPPKAIKPPRTGGNIGQFLAPKGRTPRRSGRGPRDRSEDTTYDIQRQLRDADMDILRAKQALAHDYVDQTALSIQMLDLQKQAFDAEMDHKVAKAKQENAEGRITDAALQEVVATTATLRAKYAVKDDLERRAVLEEEETKRQADFNALDDKTFEIQRDIMQKRAGLAETAGERRQLELDLLKLEYDHKRLVLERIMAESKDWREQEEARRDLAALDKNYSLDRQNVMNSTRGPWEDYLASLPTTAGKADEALQRLQVQGIEGLTDAALDAVDGLDKAGQTLLQTVKNFIRGLLQMELQKGIGSLFGSGSGSPLGGLLGGLFGGSNSGAGGMGLGTASGAFDWVTPGMGSIDVGSLPAFAGGGAFNVLGRRGVDQNVLQLNGLPIARVNYGERIRVDQGESGGPTGRRDLTQVFNFPNSDFNSFKRSQTQVARLARRGLDRA